MKKNHTASDFLTKQCGIPVEKIPNILQNIKSTDTLESTVSFLREFGFVGHQINSLVTKWPSILRITSDCLKPKIQRLKEFGLNDTQIICMSVKNPRILTLNLDRKINPNLVALEAVFGGKQNLSKALQKFPSILLGSSDHTAFLKVFKEIGIQGENLHFLVNFKPSVLIFSEDAIRSRWELINNLGIVGGYSRSSKAFGRTVGILICYDSKTLESKFQNLQDLGFQLEEVTLMLSKCPDLIETSASKLQKLMGFLVYRVGYAGIVKNPVLLRLSLEKNLRPRYEVIQYLKKVEPDIKLPRLETLCKKGEKVFLERYVKSSAHSSNLLEIYYKDYAEKTAECEKKKKDTSQLEKE